MSFVLNDGGRSKYFKGNAGDCAVRALAILLSKDYKDTYDSFNPLSIIGCTPRNGCTPQQIFDTYTEYNLVQIELFDELDIDFLKDFNVIVEYENHMQAVLKGVIHDAHDKFQPYEAITIWCHKSDEFKIKEILNYF